MKLDEFAFFNQQLAAMLRDGIPLEGALRRLCQEMHAGSLRTELQTLEADLAKGTPMADALKGAPASRTLQTDDHGRRQKRRPARGADDAGGLFATPEQPLDAAERIDDLSAHRLVRRIFVGLFFVYTSSARFFGKTLRFSPAMLTCRRFGLACGCRRFFSERRWWRRWSRFPFRRYAECCAGGCQPSRKPAWHKSHRPWD